MMLSGVVMALELNLSQNLEIPFIFKKMVNSLYVTQYISSSLDWKSAGLLLSQKVKPVVPWDPYMRVTFTLSSSKEGMAKESTLNLRIPLWTNSEGAKVSLNGQSLKVPASGNFLLIKQKWKSGDQVRIELPLSIRTEATKGRKKAYHTCLLDVKDQILVVGEPFEHETTKYFLSTE